MAKQKLDYEVVVEKCPWVAYRVIYCEGSSMLVVGGATLSWSLDRGPRAMHLDHVWISPSHRGKRQNENGVPHIQALMEHILAVARNHGGEILKGTFRAERFKQLARVYCEKSGGSLYGSAFVIPLDGKPETLAKYQKSIGLFVPPRVEE